MTFPSPGDLPKPGIEPRSLSLLADSLPAEPQEKPEKTRVGSLCLLQGIFPTQGWSPGLLHCRWILNQLSQKGSPRILEWVAYPFLRGYSQPRNQTRVSCVAGRFFTSSATREALMSDSLRPHGLSPPRLLHPWNFPGKSTGVGCHFLLQGSS